MLQQELNAIKLKREMEQMLSKNAVNMKRLHEILETLRTTDIDLEILRKTKIGVCVNNVRKMFKNSKEIAKSTAELIRKWKKIAKEEFRTKSESDSGVAASPVLSSENGDASSPKGRDEHAYVAQNDSSADSNSDDKTTTKSRKRKVSSSESIESSSSEADVKMPRNSLRRKSVNLLVEALNADTTPARNSTQLAVEIERHIYEECPDAADKKYKARIRSRVMNLRDKNNPDFKKNVLEGILEPSVVATMPVEEMASAKLKQLRQSIDEEMIKEREMKDPTAGLAKSTMFVCNQCDERDTSYTISQECKEGEYEPVAVTLIVCNKCGNRWKNF